MPLHVAMLVSILRFIAPAAAWLPADVAPPARLASDSALLVVRVQDGADAVERFHGSALWQQAVASPLAEMYRRSPDGKKAMGGLAFVRATTGLTIWETLGAALGDDAIITLSPRKDGGGPELLAIVQHRNAERARRVSDLLSRIHLATGALLDDEPDPDKTEKSGDVTIWNVPDKMHHAFVDDTLIVSNSLPALKDALARRSGSLNRLDESALWKKLVAGAPRTATLSAAVNVSALRKLAGDKWETKLPNPVAALLFSKWSHALAQAELGLGWISADASGLNIEARIAGGAEKVRDAAKKALDSTGRVLSAANLPRGLGHITLFRDFGDWWSSREGTMTEEAVGEFAKFAGNITTLLGQLDFSEEFLPNLQPGVQLVVANQSFADRVKPHPTLPAFGLVFGIKDTKKLGPRLDSAGTIAVTFINFQAANEGHPQYLVNLEEYRGHKATYTQFPDDAVASAPTSQPSRKGVRFNFEPAFARVNDRVVIATTREFMHELVDALLAIPKPGDAPLDDELMLSGAQARAILADNRDEFIANEMLKRDEGRDIVARRVDAVLEAAGWLDSVRFRAHTTDNESRVSLNVAFAKIRPAASRRSH